MTDLPSQDEIDERYRYSRERAHSRRVQGAQRRRRARLFISLSLVVALVETVVFLTTDRSTGSTYLPELDRLSARVALNGYASRWAARSGAASYRTGQCRRHSSTVFHCRVLMRGPRTLHSGQSIEILCDIDGRWIVCPGSRVEVESWPVDVSKLSSGRVIVRQLPIPKEKN